MSGYGFNNVHEALSVSAVLSKVSDDMLWRYYFGRDFELKKNYCSKLRPGDDNPSFNLYEDGRGRIMFKDFGAGGLHGDVFEFIQRTQGLTFVEALVRVNVDFRLGLGNPDQQKYSGAKAMSVAMEKKIGKFSEQFVTQIGKQMRAYSRPYTNSDYAYWEQYGITKEILTSYKVYCIRRVEVRKQINGELRWVLAYTHSDTSPCYGYHFPISKHIKCYFPRATGEQIRFLGNVNNYEDIQGYYQCNVKKDKTNKLLILTKSMKDVMCLRALGYEAMAIHGEAQYFYQDFIRHIKKYYPRIVSLYDRDETGMKGARFLWRNYRISPYFVPKSFINTKDISDVYKVYGRGEAEELMKRIARF